MPRLRQPDRGSLLRRQWIAVFRVWFEAWFEFDGQPSVNTMLDLQDRAWAYRWRSIIEEEW